MTCRNCGRDARIRSRGLCRTCYEAPGVRDRFQGVTIFSVRGHGLQNVGHRMPQEPVAALPGSAEKMVELERRAAAGYCLFHPCDGRIPE